MTFFKKKTKLEKHINLINSSCKINGLAVFLFDKIFYILIALFPFVFSYSFIAKLNNHYSLAFFEPFLGIVYTIFIILFLVELLHNFSPKGVYNYFSYIKNCFYKKYYFKDFYKEKDQALKILYEAGYNNLEMENFINHIKKYKRISTDDFRKLYDFLNKNDLNIEKNSISSSEIVENFYLKNIHNKNSQDLLTKKDQEIVFFSQIDKKNQN